LRFTCWIRRVALLRVAFGHWGLVAGWYWLAPLLVVYGWLYVVRSS
jgi:hypothetical protein